jgi:hypothetical protein
MVVIPSIFHSLIVVGLLQLQFCDGRVVFIDCENENVDCENVGGLWAISNVFMSLWKLDEVRQKIVSK